MKFGVREICDVVLKAKANQKVGNKIFYKGEPVIYFDTLKTSSMEGAATTVYAQGGRGNSRLVAWEGERTITFTMEDALISPTGFMILSGAGLTQAEDKTIYVHSTEQTQDVEVKDNTVEIYVSEKPYVKAGEDFIYVMLLDDNGEVTSEPFIPSIEADAEKEKSGKYIGKYKLTLTASDDLNSDENGSNPRKYTLTDKILEKFAGAVVLVDYYVERKSGAQQIDITPDKFGGNYYLEASTLFRDTNGVDMPAEFIIPNCKIQSNFTFTMASSGDPSSFTFTMDAFPDYTRFDREKKVLAAIQIIDDASNENALRRASTNASETHKENESTGAIEAK